MVERLYTNYRRITILLGLLFWVFLSVKLSAGKGIGSEVARLRTGHRPPLKLYVRFARIQLSRRLTLSGMESKGSTESS